MKREKRKPFSDYGRITRVKIGEVGVDSGNLLVGDPCYWLSDKDYDEISDLWQQGNWKDLYLSIKYAMGHEGRGVVFNSGWGDGVYDVYATIKDFGKSGGKRVTKVEIILIGEDDPGW